MKIHVPTIEYGFIEEEFNGTPEEAYERHNELIGICRGGVGLSEGEWRKALDAYYSLNGIEPDTYYRCNKEQQTMISELKKCQRRLGLLSE